MVFPAHENSLVNLNQEYVLGMISIQLTSISAGLHSGGSIGVGLRSGCSCFGEVCCLLHFGYPCACSHVGICKILILKLYLGHKDIETVNNTKGSRVEHKILF